MALRILMVEDDAMLGPLVAGALVEEGYEVLLVPDGPAALDILRSTAAIDVVFSDVSMPNGISGIELLEHVDRLQPQARCIIASGYAKVQLPPLPPRAVFLPKPYRIPQLVAALAS
nr:response regulator [Luteimonas cucumeris]